MRQTTQSHMFKLSGDDPSKCKENVKKTVKDCVKREEKAIYMGKIHARPLKRIRRRLSEQLENLLLAIEDLPRGPYLLKFDELRSSEP